MRIMVWAFAFGRVSSMLLAVAIINYVNRHALSAMTLASVARQKTYIDDSPALSLIQSSCVLSGSRNNPRGNVG